MGCRASKADQEEAPNPYEKLAVSGAWEPVLGTKGSHSAGSPPPPSPGRDSLGQAGNNGRALVCDNGSGAIRAGYGGAAAPACVFPNLTGVPGDAAQHCHGIYAVQDQYIGEEAQVNRGILKLSYPVKHGVVVDWDGMEKVWEYMFYAQLKQDPEGRRVVMTERPGQRKVQRERLAELLFECFGVGEVHLAVQAVLAMHRYGRDTGVVLDAGEAVTHAVPIYNGAVVHHAVRKALVGGDSLVHRMRALLYEGQLKWRPADKTSAHELIREITQGVGYVAMDYRDEMTRATTTEEVRACHALPDGQDLWLNEERFKCPEDLFAPNDVTVPALQDLVHRAVEDADPDMRGALYSSVHLAGGTTLFDGFAERLEHEVQALAADAPVKVYAPEGRAVAAWCGGAMMAERADLQLLTRELWEECGPSAVHRVFYSW